jgi:hypothetical protein
MNFMFDGLQDRDARGVALFKKATLIFLALCIVVALASGYRAYFQVYSLELRLDEPALRGGSVVRTEVVGSGRTHVTVRLELIQDARAETLAVEHVPGNDWASFDPRPRRAAQTLTLTPELLARFRPGPATLRATATGRPQWTRLPPPLVREAAVEIRRE